MSSESDDSIASEIIEEFFVVKSESTHRNSDGKRRRRRLSKDSTTSSNASGSSEPSSKTSSETSRASEENHLEPQSIVYRAGSPVDRAKSLEELRLHVDNLEKIRKEKLKKQGHLLGFKTKKQAEREVDRRGQFATYYRLPEVFDRKNGAPNDSNLSVQLNVVYLDSHFHFRHYPIRKVVSPSSRIFFQLGHSDSRKPSTEPVFVTIKNLLKHYTLFGYVDTFHPDGGIHVEIFPK